MPMDESPAITPERIIERARRTAHYVCRKHPDWDEGDLEGSIIEACVKWPPKNEGYLTLRCQAATKDWFRRWLGRHSPKMHALELLILDADVTLNGGIRGNDGDTYCPGDLLLVERETPEDVIVRHMGMDFAMQLMARVLNEREHHVLLSLCRDGMVMREVGAQLGVTESRVSQIATKARSKLQDFHDVLVDVSV